MTSDMRRITVGVLALVATASVACGAPSPEEGIVGESHSDLVNDIASMKRDANGTFEVNCADGTTESGVTAARISANDVCNVQDAGAVANDAAVVDGGVAADDSGSVATPKDSGVVHPPPPPPSGCALVSCPSGYSCEVRSGGAQCIRYEKPTTCADASCPSGYHCEMLGIAPKCYPNAPSGTGGSSGPNPASCSGASCPSGYYCSVKSGQAACYAF